MTHDHDAPELEGAARVAQFLAMSVTVVEAMARLRAQREIERAAATGRAAAAERAERIAEHASARVGWTPAHDDAWLHQANSGELAHAWTAAAMWADTDVDAREAVQRIERRLHRLHPEGMAAYDEARTAGATPPEAMRQAPQPRHPRDVASDGYPCPTGPAVSNGARRLSGTHLIATVPPSARSASR
jgi:hypothetical protein